MTTRSRITAGIGALALTGALAAAVPAAAAAAAPAASSARATAAATKPVVKATKPATKATRPATKAAKPAAKAAKPATKATKATKVTARPKATTSQLISRAVARDVAASSVVPASRFTVARVAVSRVDAAWAQAWVLPKKGVEVDPAQVVVHRDKAGWKVKDLGTAEVGCGITPTRVLSAWHVTCG